MDEFSRPQGYSTALFLKIGRERGPVKDGGKKTAGLAQEMSAADLTLAHSLADNEFILNS